MPGKSVENDEHERVRHWPNETMSKYGTAMDQFRRKESESVTRLFQKNMTDYERLEKEASQSPIDGKSKLPKL